MTIHDKINLKGLISEFPKIGEKEFKLRFRKLKIGVTGEFEGDFDITGRLQRQALEVNILYRYYADFTHQGVGNGIKKEDASIQRMVGGGRRAKPWKKGIGHIRYRLAELYQAKLGDGLEKTVKDTMDKKIQFNM